MVVAERQVRVLYAAEQVACHAESAGRRATVIERHIDPNDPRLPDFATLPPGSPDAVIDRYYRFRVLSSKTFKPGPAR